MYDYVEVYAYNKKTRMFDLHWRDDFDFLDMTRWEPSNNYGFTDNSTTFFGSQVFVQQGSLILQMDKATLARGGSAVLQPAFGQPMQPMYQQPMMPL